MGPCPLAAKTARSNQPRCGTGSCQCVSRHVTRGAAPVGFSTDVSSVGGFFLERFESYAACTRFSGCLRAQPWSLPEVFRANRTWPLGAGEGACGDES